MGLVEAAEAGGGAEGDGEVVVDEAGAGEGGLKDAQLAEEGLRFEAREALEVAEGWHGGYASRRRLQQQDEEKRKTLGK